MGKSELFYGIGEYTDDTQFCKRKGLKPYKTLVGGGCI